MDWRRRGLPVLQEDKLTPDQEGTQEGMQTQQTHEQERHDRQDAPSKTPAVSAPPAPSNATWNQFMARPQDKKAETPTKSAQRLMDPRHWKQAPRGNTKKDKSPLSLNKWHQFRAQWSINKQGTVPNPPQDVHGKAKADATNDEKPAARMHSTAAVHTKLPPRLSDALTNMETQFPGTVATAPKLAQAFEKALCDNRNSMPQSVPVTPKINSDSSSAPSALTPSTVGGTGMLDSQRTKCGELEPESPITDSALTTPEHHDRQLHCHEAPPTPPGHPSAQPWWRSSAWQNPPNPPASPLKMPTHSQVSPSAPLPTVASHATGSTTQTAADDNHETAQICKSAPRGKKKQPVRPQLQPRQCQSSHPWMPETRQPAIKINLLEPNAHLEDPTDGPVQQHTPRLMHPRDTRALQISPMPASHSRTSSTLPANSTSTQMASKPLKSCQSTKRRKPEKQETTLTSKLTVPSPSLPHLKTWTSVTPKL